jgi:hypothetical protein
VGGEGGEQVVHIGRGESAGGELGEKGVDVITSEEEGLGGGGGGGRRGRRR